MELCDFKGLSLEMATYSLKNAATNQLVGRGDAKCCNVCIEVGGEQMK